MGLFNILFGKRENDVTASNNDVSINSSDSYIKKGTNSFEFEVEDVFNIIGRGTVVTGKVLSGSIKVGEEVLIFDNGLRTTITGIEKFRKSLDVAQAGDNVGMLLSGISRDDVEKGFMIIK